MAETHRKKLERHRKLNSDHGSIEQLVKPVLAILIVSTLQLNITIGTIMSMKVVMTALKKCIPLSCVTHMQFMP